MRIIDSVTPYVPPPTGRIYGVALSDPIDRDFYENITSRCPPHAKSSLSPTEVRTDIIGGERFHAGAKIGFNCLSDVRLTTDAKYVVKKYAPFDRDVFQREIILTGALVACGIPVIPILASDMSKGLLVKPYIPGTDASLEALVARDVSRHNLYLTQETERTLLAQKQSLLEDIETTFEKNEFRDAVHRQAERLRVNVRRLFLMNDTEERSDSNLRFYFHDNRIDVMVLDP